MPWRMRLVDRITLRGCIESPRRLVPDELSPSAEPTQRARKCIAAHAAEQALDRDQSRAHALNYHASENRRSTTMPIDVVIVVIAIVIAFGLLGATLSWASMDPPHARDLPRRG
jgi:hypothetical protein